MLQGPPKQLGGFLGISGVAVAIGVSVRWFFMFVHSVLIVRQV